jgi:hypothetical protein
MSAARYDLRIEQGATFDKDIIIKVAGVVMDLSDWTGTGQIRKTRKSDTVIATITCTKSNTPTDGTMNLFIDSDDTTDIPCGENETDTRSKYVYDIELTNSDSGEVKRLMEGYVYISPEVTRAVSP